MPLAVARCSKVVAAPPAWRCASLSVLLRFSSRPFKARRRPYKASLSLRRTPGRTSPSRTSIVGGCTTMMPPSLVQICVEECGFDSDPRFRCAPSLVEPVVS
eukprot:8378039-Lingulodinium_polyedra.AAC.1